MTTHNNSPAELLQNSLVAANIGVKPSSTIGGKWPIFANHLPEYPDNAVVISDTSGVRDGRIMSTGENIDKPGFQVRVRGLTHTDAYSKIKEVIEHFEKINKESIAINGDSYRIHSVTRTGTVLTLGQEQNARRRCGFTVNGTITFTTI